MTSDDCTARDDRQAAQASLPTRARPGVVQRGEVERGTAARAPSPRFRVGGSPEDAAVRSITPESDEAKNPMFLVWLEQHGVEPKDCFQIDLGEESMVVHTYHRNERGHKHILIDPGEDGSGEIVTNEPEVIKLKSACPA